MKPERSGFASLCTSLCLVVSLWVVCSALASSRCAMCARSCGDRTAVTVSLADGKTMDYCCPHCAAMGLGMLDLARTTVKAVALSDFATGAPMDAKKATCVLDSDVVPCCAPSVLAFPSEAAARDFQAKHAGKVCSWRTVAQRLSAVKCTVCPMKIYPPTAYRVRSPGKRGYSYACCPVCALATAINAGGTASIVHWTTDPRRRLVIELEGGRITSQTPATIAVWQITPPEGEKLKCHSWVVFADKESLAAWCKAHPEAKGEAVTLESLLPRAQMKAKQAAQGA